jgi:hypothetical protein
MRRRTLCSRWRSPSSSSSSSLAWCRYSPPSSW